ncbi:MAG: carboxylate-amine ligase [bacterium]|nr:carboxylate-amine ligase [bacterium]
MEEPSWTVGVEEEYLLVERASGNLIRTQPRGLMEKVSSLHHGIVSPEFFSSQIEIGTEVCQNMGDLRAEIGLLRIAVAEAAEDYGLAPIAVSTHPFAQWEDQQVTQAKRYQELAADLQGVIRRLVISGLHVHVGIEDPELRIDLMGQVTYFLPHLLALSGSSPFWEGRDTGLKSYRPSVFSAAPRTGLPEQFGSWAEFQRHIDVLVAAGIIEDSSKVWWDIRPSARYPTLEMRVTDLPTRMEDTVAIAAVYVCVLRMLWRLRMENKRWRSYTNFLVSENLWRAQRYGVRDQLIDFGKGTLVPFSDLVEELIELVRPDAEAMGYVSEVEHIRTICQRGTSADHQIAVYREALEGGATEQEAMKAVVQMLIRDTLAPAVG